MKGLQSVGSAADKFNQWVDDGNSIISSDPFINVLTGEHLSN
jgi:hypothetical protein